ncbi:uncharacterized protein L201_003164 [Kwoniella dendrophila CBS 6074]|uniref:Peptidase S1 domain-containing protein n=1 Tax=Kwoniella dendrophila CBS 6074 TaxID=1295534 RepID=A0AAX4JUM5_9TREE
MLFNSYGCFSVVHRHKPVFTSSQIRKYATSSNISIPITPVNRQLSSKNTITDQQRFGDDLLFQHIHDNLSSITQYQPLPSGSHRFNLGRTLPHILPYEPYPNRTRRADSTETSDIQAGDGIVVVVHLVQDSASKFIDYVVSSGFAIDPQGQDDGKMVVTCSHTLDQISTKYPDKPIHSFILPSTPDPTPIPITSFPSSSISDLLICTLPKSPTINQLRSLPVSPFPVYKGQKVLVHKYGTTTTSTSGIPWIKNILRREWKTAEMFGYRNYGWREVQPGTSSALPYITFSTRPSPGSSGGPIIDAISGSVVGIVSGSRTLSAVKGERGYGSSAENIFELFTLPGFIPSSQKYKA